MSTRKGYSSGKCQFCKQAFAKKEMEAHPDSCGKFL